MGDLWDRMRLYLDGRKHRAHGDDWQVIDVRQRRLGYDDYIEKRCSRCYAWLGAWGVRVRRPKQNRPHSHRPKPGE